MKRSCDAGKWWVSLNDREVFRGHSRGPALSYASSLALVSVFDRKLVSIEVHGPGGVVWRYEESDIGPAGGVAVEESAVEVAFQEASSAAGFSNG